MEAIRDEAEERINETHRNLRAKRKPGRRENQENCDQK